MKRLPSEWLEHRQDQPWEDEIREQRISYALRFAARQIAEIEMARSLGATDEELEGRIKTLWDGVLQSLTRRELASAFMSWATTPGMELWERWMDRKDRDLEFLDKVNWDHDWKNSRT